MKSGIHELELPVRPLAFPVGNSLHGILPGQFSENLSNTPNLEQTLGSFSRGRTFH